MSHVSDIYIWNHFIGLRGFGLFQGLDKILRKAAGCRRSGRPG